MKKITSIILILATLLSLALLTSCKKSDAPEGLQLVKGGADYAYSFYAPEEWVVANLGDMFFVKPEMMKRISCIWRCWKKRVMDCTFRIL